MIHPILKFLANQLNDYIKLVKKESATLRDPFVLLQSLVHIDENKIKETENLLITLVNLSEETALKNMDNFTIKVNETVYYKNPPVNLNIFIMITAVMSQYENELIYLSHAINFFQGKSIFTQLDSANVADGLPEDFRISVDLYSLSFEQLNYVWSTLGGKQHPFVCYKIRMVEMERESTSETRGVIKQIRIDDAPGV
jgi:hypothetical protein